MPSVRGILLVRGIRLAMHLNEEPLHVPVEAALAHLVRLDFYEGVMSPFRSDGELHRTERPGERARARAGRRGGQADGREELVGRRDDVGRNEMRAMKVAHGPWSMALRRPSPGLPASSRSVRWRSWNRLNRGGTGWQRPIHRRGRSAMFHSTCRAPRRA